MNINETNIQQLMLKLRALALTIPYHNKVDIEDLVQDALLHIISPTQHYVNVFVFARSRMLDYIKQHGYTRFKNKNHRVPMSQKTWSEISTEPEEYIDKPNLDCLTDIEKRIVEGIYYEDKTQNEVAKELGVYPMFVHRKLKAIHKKLKPQYE